MASLEEVCSWGWALRFEKSKPGPEALSLSLIRMQISAAALQLACSLAMLPKSPKLQASPQSNGCFYKSFLDHDDSSEQRSPTLPKTTGNMREEIYQEKQEAKTNKSSSYQKLKIYIKDTK